MRATGGIDHAVVMLAKFGGTQITTDFDVAKETQLRRLRQAFKAGGNGFDPRMIRSHTITHQTKGGRQALVQIDLCRRHFLHQGFCGVKAAWA